MSSKILNWKPFPDLLGLRVGIFPISRIFLMASSSCGMSKWDGAAPVAGLSGVCQD